MPDSTLKVVILMAGFGTRLRPHTYSKPKQLIRMADKRVLDHVLDSFNTIPASLKPQFIFIIGYLGVQIRDYMQLAHPELSIRYIEQTEMRGQSHAISLARDFLDGPVVTLYADTLIDTDFSFLTSEPAGGVAWVKPVPDPRRFGVANPGKDGWVTHLVEKPKDVDNNLALVGCYYFQDSHELLGAIDEQMQRNISLKNEFYLADAINVMLEHGLKLRIQPVQTWLDAGTPEDVLNTNRYFLDHAQYNATEIQTYPGSIVIPPVYIHPTARIENSVIGPHAVIGAGCSIESCIIRDSILDDGSNIANTVMEHSLIGREVKIQRQAGTFNLGDQAVLTV